MVHCHGVYYLTRRSPAYDLQDSPRAGPAKLDDAMKMMISDGVLPLFQQVLGIERNRLMAMHQRKRYGGALLMRLTGSHL